MAAPVLTLFIFFVIQFVFPSHCLFETSKFVKKEVCSNHFIKLDKPSRKMLASICETQCMIVCHDTEGCSISKCESNAYCVLGKYDFESNIDIDDCTATEKMWVSFEAYQNSIKYEKDQLDIPICDGCGSREQECWETCKEENGEGNERGFCEKCNSYTGTKGACCMLNNPSDPEECLGVPESSFLYTTYHMCVLVPVQVCPESCKTCKTGGAGDGGKAVNSEGICEYFCSTSGYCGDGQYHTSGEDCSLCKPGFTLITKSGNCVSKEGERFSRCIAYGLRSKDECQAACITLDLCLAFNYREASAKCRLMTTSKPSNGCPNGATWKDTGIFAKSVDDLKEHSQGGDVCYAKINVDKNVRR